MLLENPENKPEILSSGVRMAIGIPLIFVFCGITGFCYMFGLGIGVMATDGCGGSEIPDIASMYLTFGWPAIMGITSIVPALIFIIKDKVILSVVLLTVGIIVSVVWYIGWFYIVSYYCGGSV